MLKAFSLSFDTPFLSHSIAWIRGLVHLPHRDDSDTGCSYLERDVVTLQLKHGPTLYWSGHAVVGIEAGSYPLVRDEYSVHPTVASAAEALMHDLERHLRKMTSVVVMSVADNLHTVRAVAGEP